MFEVGFSELLLISVLALVVLGPKKLPHLVSKVGHWVGRARGMARQLREQLDREVNLEETLRETFKNPAPPADPVDAAPPNDPIPPRSPADSAPSPHRSGHE